MSDEVQKDHAFEGYLFAVIFGVIAVLLMSALNTMEQALLAAPFLIGWALLSISLFGRSDAEQH
jgi:uncharacterized membrane protein